MNKLHSSSFKYEAIMAYKNDRDHSVEEICSRYAISNDTLYDWIKKYEKYGREGLENAKNPRTYPEKVKTAAVKDYLSGRYSLRQAVLKHGLSSTSLLCGWIKKYNGHREPKKATEKGRSDSMTKGRKTSWEERIQIASHCLENHKDYRGTAEKYDVSYQQVYHWVRKYQAQGAEALKDRRGRTRREIELTAEEKAKRETKRMAKENERLRAEVRFLKKLKEIERGQS